MDQRGIVVRNKARLETQGHRQEEGIDYDEVFASISRIEAIMLFLIFASFMGFTVYQMDVKNAFLYGTIEEEVYVNQPLGFVDPEFPTRVYKVEKALYGLHQAPRAWYETLSTYLMENGFRRGTMLAVMLNMDILQTESTPEEHQYVITDVRFRPNSTRFVTASFDQTVRIWDAADAKHLSLTGERFKVVFVDDILLTKAGTMIGGTSNGMEARKEKDSLKLKRLESAYFLFMNERRDALVAKSKSQVDVV
ncbi:putative ribonuclease H-like domain-containing protein [Tanacetum coccineum]|uniref:Ribonuclease H-like domain-containing protein n=1 Tax=Tanacetum coccineum TaxID=301880 RepID=A0ABQ5GL89_9ASTR